MYDLTILLTALDLYNQLHMMTWGCTEKGKYSECWGMPELIGRSDNSSELQKIMDALELQLEHYRDIVLMQYRQVIKEIVSKDLVGVHIHAKRIYDEDNCDSVGYVVTKMRLKHYKDNTIHDFYAMIVGETSMVEIDGNFLMFNDNKDVLDGFDTYYQTVSPYVVSLGDDRLC